MKKNIKPDNFTQETINAVQAIIDDAEYFKNSYFWTPGGNSSSRKSYDRKHSHDTVTWTENGHDYSACFSVRSSYANYRVSSEYYKDGQKTNLKAIRYSLDRMKKALSNLPSA